jgi:RHS repeat-associated protein
LSYTKNGSGTEIIEESNYYPFGLKHQGYNQTQGNPSYKYQYNGKEIQEETGWSDFGARMYMSDIGRWGVIDPLAETSRRFTPYNYAYNNPISFIDPDGRKAMAIDQSWSWNVPVDSGWFTMGSSRRKFGSLDEFVEMTSSNEREKGGGGGGSSAGGMTFTDPTMIAFIQQGASQPGFINGLFSLVEQLEKAGFKDPAKTKAKFEDASKISGISAIKDVVTILNYVAKQPTGSNIFFEKTDNWMIDGQSRGYKILLNMDNIKSVLELAYIIGHETNHSVTDYFRSTFYDTVGSSGPMGRNAFSYFTELVSYSWEEVWGYTRKSLNASDYTYYIHGPNSPIELLRHSQTEVDLVNNNMRTLLKLYNNFITIPKQ